MSRSPLKFVGPIGTPTLTNSPIASGDSLEISLGKLQAQINNLSNFGLIFSDNVGSASTKTWTVPSGVYIIKFMLFGPGANGSAGRSSNPRTGGGGGGSGAWCEGSILVSPGNTISYSIPAGNSASNAWLVASSGNSSIIAGPGAAGSTNGTGGLGGTASVGSDHTARVLGFTGQQGGNGFAATVSIIVGVTTDYGGDGGNTPKAYGGRGKKDTGTASNGQGWGSGGGGADNGSTPGNGSPAGLIIWY